MMTNNQLLWAVALVATATAPTPKPTTTPHAGPEMVRVSCDQFYSYEAGHDYRVVDCFVNGKIIRTLHRLP